MKKALKILGHLLFFVIVGFCIGLLVNPVAMFDIFRLSGYSLEPELAALADDLDLTDAGRNIYTASHPTLDDRDSFNKNCESYNSDVTVLGCYGDKVIHVFDVETSELPGIIESTMAHELLHAAWARLPFWEQISLKTEIEAFYSDHKAELSAELDRYPEESLLDELHSRIGTEFKDLPAALETHYAKYFKDQDAIVAYYDDYSEKFLELSQEISDLDAEIDELKPEIDEMKATYHRRQVDLNARIDEFNACASKNDCFTEAEFNAQRKELVDEQSEVEEYYNELNKTIERYNTLIDEYNNNVLRSRTLENAINSNSDPRGDLN